MKFVLYILMGNLIGQMWQSAISMETSWSSNPSFSENTIWIFLWRHELTVLYFKIFLTLNNLHSSYLNVDWPNLRKDPIFNHILMLFKIIILWNYQLEFFRQGGLRRDFLSMMGYLVKMICFIFVQSFFAPHWQKISHCGCASCFKKSFVECRML